ncbi:unnamed protein product [Adineta ricciae]|uniref:Uncharacterized protein n=1 Tax=Adineta ricciae TaxID=249248 RepID=A0A814SNB2_ADIRI|nr:unnamed protein product [Adineta ricciae]
MNLKDLLYWFREHIYYYNAFIPDETDLNEEENQVAIVKHQLYATRLYIPLLIIIIYIITLVTIITPQIELITISNIDASLFNKLSLEHADTLSCPCSTTTIPYEKFVSNRISFHPICLSIFVSEQWIQALYLSDASTYLVMDFRTTASSQFELLAALCRICQDTVAQSVAEFNNKQFVTVELLQEDKVHTQIMTDVTLIRTNLPIQVTTPLKFLQIITTSNTLITALNTNIFVYISSWFDGSFHSIADTTYYFNTNMTSSSGLFGASCSVKSFISPTGFYELPEFDRVFNHYVWPTYPPSFEPSASAMVDGFFAGCNPLDALLASTLDCLYDTTCLSNFTEFFPNLNQANFNWSNGLPSTSRQDIPLESLLKNLLIKEWSTTVNYSQYFASCGATVCTYSQVIHFIQHIPKLFTDVKELNLFKSVHNRTPIDLKKQYITTRVYLILLISSISVLLLFTLLRVEIVTLEEANPSIAKFQDLNTLYSDSLKCPCSNINTPYKAMTTWSPTFHQVCSSDFIREEWLAPLPFVDLSLYGWSTAWRGFSTRHFRLLSTLCQLANSSVIDALQRFGIQSFVTLNAISHADFNAQLNITFNQFIQSFVTNFDLLVGLVQLFTQIDQPYTKGDNAAFVNPISLDNEQVLTLRFSLNGVENRRTSTVDCICATDPTCQTQVVDPVGQIYAHADDVYDDIPGAILGCFVVDSFLRSTLECYYSQSCLTVQYKYINFSLSNYDTGLPFFNAHLLAYDPVTSRFPPNTTLDTIVKQLMIEQWNPSFSFEHYYNSCAPIKCLYPHVIRTNTFLGTILIMISSIGGLIAALRLITPHLVTIFFRTKSNQPQINHNVDSKFLDRMKGTLTKLFRQLFTTMTNLNIFPLRTFGSRVDRRQATYFGQLSTRLYIVLLLISMSILTLYNEIQPRILRNILTNPTYNVYEKLLSTHDDTLRCPCSSISSTYEQFVTAQPIFHPICTSQFVLDEWRVNLTNNLASDLSTYSKRDYRRFLSSHLQLLSGLCSRSMKSVNNSIDQLLSSYFVSNQLLPSKKLQTNIDLLVNQSQFNAPSSFTRYLSLLRSVNHGNAIVSAYETNYVFINPWVNTTPAIAITEAIVYDDDCSCALNLNCTSPARFVQANTSEVSEIQGLKIGCTPSEAYLASTLECFYDSDCVRLILENIYNMSTFIDANLHSLVQMNNSRFSMNTTILNLVNELFMENWLTTTNYSAYFEQCAPSSCEYTYTQELTSLYTLTVLLSLYGGLSFILKWMCPKIVLVFVKIKRKKTVKPTSSMVTVIVASTINSQSASTAITIPKHSSSSIYYYFILGLILFIFLIALMIVATIYINRQVNSLYPTPSISLTSTLKSTTNDETSSTTGISTSSVISCPLTFQQLTPFTNDSIHALNLIAVGDFNEDRYFDLALTGSVGALGKLSIALGNNDGTFHIHTTFTTDNNYGTNSITVADFNNDGHDDIGIRLSNFNNDIVIYIGNGNGSFQSLVTFPSGSAAQVSLGFTVGDLNNDDYLDVVVFGVGVSILFGDIHGDFNTSELFSVNSTLRSSFVGTGDFNNDNRLDLAILDNSGNSARILLNSGNTSFQQSTLLYFGAFSFPNSLAVGDFNKDDYLDLAVVNANRNNVAVHLGNNNGTFGNQLTLPTGTYSSPYWVVVDDFNNDNNSDIVVSNSNLHTIGFWSGLGDGMFLPQMTFSTGATSVPEVFVEGDFNGDGKLDVAIIDNRHNTLVILMNTCDCCVNTGSKT